MKRLFYLLFYLLLFFSNYAQIGGTYTYAFLNLSNSPRSAALGGYNIAIGDRNMILENPAVMDSNSAGFFNFSYVKYFSGINWGYAYYSFAPSKYGYFATGIRYFNYGKFIAADENGNITGEFTAADYSFNLLWSYSLDSNWSVGVNLKPIMSFYETYSSYGFASDWALFYKASKKNISAGLIFKNLGTQIKPYIEQNNEKLPFDIQIGIYDKFEHAPFAITVMAHHLNILDLSYENNNDDIIVYDNTNQTKTGEIADLTLRHFIFGFEIIPVNSFFISFGYNYQRRQELKLETKPGLAGFSAGVGLNLKTFSFYYSISKYNISESTQFFSFSFDINNLLRTKK